MWSFTLLANNFCVWFFTFVFHQFSVTHFTQCRCVRKCWIAEVISNSVFLGVEVEMSIASGGERNPTLQAGSWQRQPTFFPPPLTYLTLPQKLAGFTVVGLIEGNGCFKPNKPWWKCRQFHERIPLNLDRTMIYPSWESKGQCHAPPKRHFNQPSWSQQKHLNKAFLGLALELFPWISDNHTQQMMLKGCSL